ncbi:hypothetical protein J2X16_001813 [Pelomonas aquatica]|uniref:Uncharacterized protein n=1 Tax=Pelomonas aquatica TaxID=431058 RepID=A0ABU1Z777_9BURK|nr:hypothetical protein [Pelomonas aquatica]MDR7296474.1 hypothetical protein [Pelomonas aquatica]
MLTNVEFSNEAAHCCFLCSTVGTFRWAATDVRVSQEMPHRLWQLNPQKHDLILKITRLGEPQPKLVACHQRHLEKRLK